MKYIIVFINALAIAIYHLIFGDPVSVSAKIPGNIEAGKDFVIEITVNKAQVAGFAKLQLEIPPAFVASEVDSKGGSFSASGRIVKIIWTSVPSDAELLIKMTVSVPANATGDLAIKGKFSYIENNVKQETEFPEVPIKLGGAAPADVASQPATNTPTQPATDASTQPASDVANQPAAEPVATGEPVATPATTSTESQAFSKPNEPDAAVAVSRKITALDGANNFEVNVNIKKGAIKGFAKLSEKIPVGYKAEQVNVSGSSFAFENGEAKFIWTSIPAAEDIAVSYKLVPDGASIQSPSYIEGSKFSYIEGDQTKKIALDRQEVIADGQTTASSTQTQTATEPVATNTTPAVDVNAVATEVAKEPVTTTETAATTTASAPKNGNIHYSIQIGAFKNGVSASALGRKYSLSETIKTEMQDGFTKCILGKFDEYKTARDNRETVKNKGVSDAFVTAYNSGKRITVQEALMVSNQKWYK
ncbi:MAG TPA: SPOR domain-containing protein [Bacteroidia bacterium]|nr:SPOR domain-containing protein [Bacteroidia bacterium]